MWGEGIGRRALIAMAGVTVGLGTVAYGAGAQTEDDLDQVCVTADFNDVNLIVGGLSRSAVVPIALPAGVIHIPEAVSWDGYPTRGDVVQLSERWEVEFLDASGNIIAVSEPTPDVPDNVIRGEYIGPLPSVTLPADAAGVRAHHRPDLPHDGTPQSVYVSGITLCWTPTEICVDDDGNVVDPEDDGSCPPAGPTPTTTVPPSTTLPPSTEDPSTTTPPPVCLDEDGNVIDPEADGSCPPTGPTLPTTSTTVPTTDDPVTTTSSTPPPAGPSVPGSGGSGGRLPVTGSSTTIYALSGLWLIAAGTTAALYARQRNAA